MTNVGLTDKNFRKSINNNSDLNNLCKEFYTRLYESYSNTYRFQRQFRMLRAFDEGNIKDFLIIKNKKFQNYNKGRLKTTIEKQQYTNFIKQTKDLKVAQRNSTETPIYVSIAITKTNTDPDQILLLESMMSKAINHFFKSGHFWQNYRLALDDFFLLGTSILAHHYDANDKLKLRKIDPSAFFVPPYVFSDLKEASYVITSRKISKETIISEGLWTEKELKDIPSNVFYSYEQGNIYAGAPYSEGAVNRDMYSIYFYHRKELDKIVGKYVIRIYAILGNLVKDVTPSSLDTINKVMEQQEMPQVKPYLEDYPFLVFSQYPNSQNFFGGSICSKILPAQINVVKLQTLLSLTIDRSQNKGVLYDKTKFENGSSNAKMSMQLRDGVGLALPVKGDPTTAIVPIPISNNSEYIENSLDTVIKSIQTDTGIGDAYTGENTQGARNNLLFQSLIARQEQIDRLDDKQIVLTLNKLVHMMISNFQKKAAMDLLALAKDKQAAQQMSQDETSQGVNTLLTQLGDDYSIDIKLCKDTVKEFQALQAIFNLEIQTGNRGIVKIEDLIEAAEISNKDKYYQRAQEEDAQIAAEKVQYVESLRQNYGAEVANQADQMLHTGIGLQEVETQIQQEIQQQQQGQMPPQNQQQNSQKGAQGGNSIVNGSNTNNIMKANGSKI